MPISIWELLRFAPEALEERLRTMTFQEREAQRLEVLAQLEQHPKTKGEKQDGLPK
jgi:hypothetical protein